MAEEHAINGTGNGAPPSEAGAGTATTTTTTTKATVEAARVEEMISRSLSQTRDWINRKRLAPEVLPATPRLSTRDWLVRASFTLFAVVVMGVVVFSALGLLSASEAIAALSPVTTLTAVIVGVYLGDRSPG
jgi:hypothetical protein